jgi:hypothetical protein
VQEKRAQPEAGGEHVGSPRDVEHRLRLHGVKREEQRRCERDSSRRSQRHRRREHETGDDTVEDQVRQVEERCRA